MAKIDVYCKIKKRNMRIDEKIAKVLVRANRAEYLTKPVVEYQNRMMVAENTSHPKGTLSLGVTMGKVTEVSVGADKKAHLKKILDDAGVEYDGRLGEAKLQELVDGLGGQDE